MVLRVVEHEVQLLKHLADSVLYHENMKRVINNENIGARRLKYLFIALIVAALN